MGAGIGAAFGGLGALVGGLIGGVAGLLATPLGLARFPPEGPEHGEGGRYEVEDIDAARRPNLALQNRRLEEAINAYREWKEGRGARSGGLPPHRVLRNLVMPCISLKTVALIGREQRVRATMIRGTNTCYLGGAG